MFVAHIVHLSLFTKKTFRVECIRKEEQSNQAEMQPKKNRASNEMADFFTQTQRHTHTCEVTVRIAEGNKKFIVGNLKKWMLKMNEHGMFGQKMSLHCIANTQSHPHKTNFSLPLTFKIHFGGHFKDECTQLFAIP